MRSNDARATPERHHAGPEISQTSSLHHTSQEVEMPSLLFLCWQNVDAPVLTSGASKTRHSAICTLKTLQI